MEIGRVPQNAYKYLLLLLCAVGVAAFWYRGYQPKMGSINRLKDEVEKLTEDVRQIEIKKQELAEIKTHVAQLDSEIQYLEEAFAEELYIPKVLFFIETLAKATEIDIHNIRPGSSSAKRNATAPTASKRVSKKSDGELKEFNASEQYRTSVYDFELAGTFRDFCNFFTDLASFPKLVVVEKFSLQTQATVEAQTQTVAAGENVPLRLEEREVIREQRLTLKMPLTFYVQIGGGGGDESGERENNGGEKNGGID